MLLELAAMYRLTEDRTLSLFTQIIDVSFLLTSSSFISVFWNKMLQCFDAFAWMRRMDGRIVHCGIISLCQSAANFEIVKHFWSLVGLIMMVL